MREGGFCIGVRDDAYSYADGRLEYGGAVSRIRVYGEQSTVYELRRIHPGMHDLCPMAYYPTWKTVSQLPAGEYVFATSVFFSDCKIPAEEPSVTVSAGSVRVDFLGQTRTVEL